VVWQIGSVGSEVEALLHNKDIGFVNQGQVAEVKADTFNFTQ
jgi:hemolysin D